jgi:hypothetical protein
LVVEPVVVVEHLIQLEVDLAVVQVVDTHHLFCQILLQQPELLIKVSPVVESHP